jgi:mRNA interferase RelE/StbE
MAALNGLPITTQLPLIEAFGKVTRRHLAHGTEELGHFDRSGKQYYRLRCGEYRIYFEQRGETLYAHYILHRGTLADFIFRMRLPYQEESLLEQDQSFWKYLEHVASGAPKPTHHKDPQRSL